MADEMMNATTIAAQKIAMLAALDAARCEKYASAAPMPAITTNTSAESELPFLISSTSSSCRTGTWQRWCG
jgi:hypothetical protein